MRISDWSSDVYSSDLPGQQRAEGAQLLALIKRVALARHLLLCGALLSQVMGGGDDHLLALVFDQAGGNRHPDRLAVIAAELHLVALDRALLAQQRQVASAVLGVDVEIAAVRRLAAVQQLGSTSCRGRGCKYV